MSEGRSDVQYMLRNGCSWRILWIPDVATGVVSRPCGRFGGEGKILLKWIWRRMNLADYYSGLRCHLYKTRNF